MSQETYHQRRARLAQQAAARRREALARHEAGESFATIGKALGCSRQRAHIMARRAEADRERAAG